MTIATSAPYLILRLGGEVVGVSLGEVREIVALQAPTRVPSVPAWILGVVNLRGTVLPLIDLGLKFGFGPTPLGVRACVVVVDLPHDGATAPMGVVAESVEDVTEVAPDEVDPVPPFGVAIRVEFLRGLVRRGERWIPLLALAQVLSHDELIAVSDTGADSIADDQGTT